MPQRGGRIRIGNGARVCRFVQFAVASGAELNIGSHVFIGRGVNISVAKRVVIGADTLVAGHVSIHDNNHVTADPARCIRVQGFTSEPLEIGEDCWIGTRAILLSGCGLGRRCVIGAGAVLTRKMPNYTTAVGIPAKQVQLPAAA